MSLNGIKKKNIVYLGLGCNLGDCMQTLHKCIEKLSMNGIEAHRTSSVYQSKAMGFNSDDLFLNMVAECFTELNPIQLLKQTQKIEKELGRVSKTNQNRYESRKIDIDILLYGNEVIDELNLQIPHNQITHRDFVSKPLKELIPEGKHPISGKTMTQIDIEVVDKNDLLIVGSIPFIKKKY